MSLHPNPVSDPLHTTCDLCGEVIFVRALRGHQKSVECAAGRERRRAAESGLAPVVAWTLAHAAGLGHLVESRKTAIVRHGDGPEGKYRLKKPGLGRRSFAPRWLADIEALLRKHPIPIGEPKDIWRTRRVKLLRRAGEDVEYRSYLITLCRLAVPGETLTGLLLETDEDSRPIVLAAEEPDAPKA